MSSGFDFSRRAMLLGGGCAVLGGALWLGRRSIFGFDDAASAEAARLEASAKALRWPDLRPVSPEDEAAALRARIEARRRGELRLPPEPARNPMATAGLGGFVSHESAAASDWVDGAALDTSPAADAPFSWGIGHPPRPEDLVTELDGRLVALPGYAVPLDADLDGVRSFLLAPYVGACIHVPPPPPNQIVLVSSDAPYSFREMFEPILVVGEMRVEPARSALAEVGYQIRAGLIRPFDAQKDAG